MLAPEPVEKTCLLIRGLHQGSGNRTAVLQGLEAFYGKVPKLTVNPQKLETGLRSNSAGIPHTSFSRIEAIAFPTFGLLL